MSWGERPQASREGKYREMGCGTCEFVTLFSFASVFHTVSGEMPFVFLTIYNLSQTSMWSLSHDWLAVLALHAI